MEVKIGVQNTPREIVLESTQTQDEVEQAVTAALSSTDAALVLHDEKGRRVMVPSAAIAYVEIAEVDHRRVGFGIPDNR